MCSSDGGDVNGKEVFMTPRKAVIASVLIWVAVAIPMWVMKGVFFSTFFVLLLSLVVIVPASIETLTNKRWFCPVMAIWSGIAVPACFHALRWSGSLPHKCDHLFVPLGVFACVSFLCVGFREAWKKRLSRVKEPEQPSPERTSSELASSPHWEV